jgi:hypothetical protein
MALGLQNYAVIIPKENSYVKFNNHKINSLQIALYDFAQNYRIIHNVVQLLFRLNLRIWKRHHIQKLNQNKD